MAIDVKVPHQNASAIEEPAEIRLLSPPSNPIGHSTSHPCRAVDYEST
jgi:hypothetical protein